MPRPKRFTKEQVAEALRKGSGIRSSAARILRCHPKTVSDYIKRYPTLNKVIEQVVDETLDEAEAKLIELIRERNVPAIIFFLKTKGKRRGYSERFEMTGADGAAPTMHLFLPQLEERRPKPLPSTAEPPALGGPNEGMDDG